MGILETVIRRRVLTSVVVLIALILGGLSYSSLGLRAMPEIEFPMVTITTIYPGGSPEEIESEVTRPIEDAISSISGIEEIQSYSQQGMSLVLVQFDLDQDIDVKKNDVDDKLQLVQMQLPPDAEDPVVGKFDIGQMPVITLALVGPQPVNELFRLADEEFRDRLSQVPGVADVQVTGGQRREIQVLLDAVKLRKHRVSVDEVARAIQSTNVEVPAGHITEGDREYVIRTTGRLESVEQILRAPVRNTGQSTLEVRHLGRVVDGFEEERSRSHADGGHSVILSVLKQSDANDVDVADGIRAALPQLRRRLPEGAELFVAEDTSDYIRGALANVRTNMLMGIGLTCVVLYLFLGSWRGMLVAAVVIPAAVVVSFSFLLFSDFTLNILTLTALALCVGIVVNNSILVLENTERFMEQGLPPVQAAIASTRDIGLAIFSSTATNLVVFLPLAFMGEIVGRFFREFGLTIVYTTLVSLSVSFTLTPMMCGALLRARQKGNPGRRAFRPLAALTGFLPWLWRAGFNRVKAGYLAVLGWCLRWRKTTVLLTLLAMAGCMLVAARVIGMEFFPQSDEGTFRIAVETPVGSSLEFTNERVKEVERLVSENIPPAYLRHYYARVGRVAGFLGSSSTATNIGEVTVTLVDRAERPVSVQEILNDLRPLLATVHSAKLTASAGGHAGPGGAAITVELTGEDLDDLRHAAADVMDELRGVPGLSDVDQSWRSGQPEVRIVPLVAQAGRHHLSKRDIAQAVRTYVEGATVSQFKDRGEDYDIRIKLDEQYRRWAEDVERMFIKSPATGGMIPIGQVAELRYGSGPTVIMRKDRRRLINVTAELTGERPLGSVQRDIDERLRRNVSLPPGVDIAYGGQTEMMGKNFAELFRAMGTAAVLTFLCVAGIIESFVLGAIIIMAIPVCLIGVVLSMLVWNTTLSILSLMALIMLVGMVVNNAIIVLDYTTRQEHKDLSPAHRVRQACDVRFRLMMMANLTTIAAMVPLSLGLGFAGEIFKPIAVVEIGGILAAATLSLLVTPVIYVMVETRRERARAARRREQGAHPMSWV